MGIPLTGSYTLNAKQPIEDRFVFKTVADMTAFKENFLPKVYFCTVEETGKFYVFNKENDIDPDTGKWRELAGGEGGSAKTFVLKQDQPSSKWEVNHKLGKKIPSSIVCIDDNGDEMFGDVRYMSANYLEIDYCEDVTGTCYITE